VVEVVDCDERGFLTALTSPRQKNVTEVKIKSSRTKLVIRDELDFLSG
jgi:hypothetical protein